MDILLIIIAALCVIVGIAGCVLPALPGPPLAYLGLIILEFCEGIDIAWWLHASCIFLVLIVTALDFLVPVFGTKLFKGSKFGERGSLIGAILGIFFMPLGIILGPFFGAVIGELIGGKNGTDALRSGIGAFIGFLIGTASKLLVCFYILIVFVIAII